MKRPLARSKCCPSPALMTASAALDTGLLTVIPVSRSLQSSPPFGILSAMSTTVFQEIKDGLRQPSS